MPRTPLRQRRARHQARSANRRVPTAVRSAPELFSSLAPIKTTIVYDSYWAFAAERQAILMRRTRGLPAPWTDDSILRRHKFTNVYRAADRASQYLIRNVIYAGSDQPEEVVFRILLFKLFNKIETWDLLTRTFETPTWRDFKVSTVAKALANARSSGQTIYSGAYIMPSGRSNFGSPAKHRNHLELLDHMMRDDVVGRIGRATSLAGTYEILRSYPTLGPFLAFQFAIDLNYSTVIDFNEDSFVVPGPGARDGIAKCFSDRGGLSESEIIKLVTDRQESEFRRRGLTFEQLGGRSLKLIDCQNLFCEVDKYARVKHPEVAGRSGRTRIKQVFVPKSDPLTLWFPPKWGINRAVQDATAQSPS